MTVVGSATRDSARGTRHPPSALTLPLSPAVGVLMFPGCRADVVACAIDGSHAEAPSRQCQEGGRQEDGAVGAFSGLVRHSRVHSGIPTDTTVRVSPSWSIGAGAREINPHGGWQVEQLCPLMLRAQSCRASDSETHYAASEKARVTRLIMLPESC